MGISEQLFDLPKTQLLPIYVCRLSCCCLTIYIDEQKKYFPISTLRTLRGSLIFSGIDFYLKASKHIIAYTDNSIFVTPIGLLYSYFCGIISFKP